MLAHSRGGAGQFQPTNINALIEEAAGLAYHGLRAQDLNFNIGLENSYDPALPMISVVPQDISRAILEYRQQRLLRYGAPACTEIAGSSAGIALCHG